MSIRKCIIGVLLFVCCIFAPNSAYIARCSSLVWNRFPTKYDVQLSKNNFQTRSNKDQVPKSYTGWKTETGRKYYYKKGVKVTGWQKIKNKWYKFSSKKGIYTGVNKKKTIVLDAGHSGALLKGSEPLGPGSKEYKSKYTAGTKGVATGVPEYRMNLTIAGKLKKELEKRDYRVIMTRKNHKAAPGNKARAQIANKAKADAYIRIHVNGSGDRSVNGAMTICTTSNSPFVSRKLSAKNKKLSTKVLDEFVKTTRAKKQFVWETDAMSGNNWSKVPTTIIEMGYMSNAKEDRKMQTKSYQKKIVKGIANGLDKYFK